MSMDKLDINEVHDVYFLHYVNPRLFYLYLRRQVDVHAKMQKQLQDAMRATSATSDYRCFQHVAVRDHHMIWHRAVIVRAEPLARVYFIDTGREEDVVFSPDHLRPLPSQFVRPAAFAIPCRLYQIRSLDSLQPFSWKDNDPVHDEWKKMMNKTVQCRVCRIEDDVCYEVDLDLPDLGNLASYLLNKRLVARHTMRSVQTNEKQFQFGRTPVTLSASTICTFPPQDGHYIITQVHSALEFYGHSQLRERELEAVQKRLETLFNANQDQSLSVHFLMEGVPCVVQQGEKYHRVVIKHRESETRVLVKLVDRGDEIIVDTSELLQLESNYCSIPVFAQPFRLHGFDESQSNAQITRKLKRLLLNQRVQITQHLPAINGFYPVEVRLSDNQLLNQVLLSNESPVVDLPAPQKLLTASSVNRSQPGRFTAAAPPRPEGNGRPERFRERSENDAPRGGLNNNRREAPPPPPPKPVFDAGDHFPPSALPREETVSFVVSHIESLSDIFIQLLSKGAELSQLTESLQTACHLSPEVPVSTLKIDRACLAKSTDQCWYRARVLSTGITKIKVRFVDFGDTLDVENRHVRLLEKKFCLQAPYAYRCSLQEELQGDIGQITDACAGKDFRGRLLSSNQRFVLHSDEFQALFRPKRLPCDLVYLDFDHQQIFLQENPSLMEKIRSQVEKEFPSNASPPPSDLQCSSIVLSMFEDAPYRARIESIDAEHVQVYFVDYGNAARCEKKDLKQCSEDLKRYPYQARACRLSGVTSMDLEQLEEYLDVDGLEVCRVDDGSEVLLYHHGQCLNQLQSDEEHSTTGTTVKEQDRPATNKRNNDQILSPPSVSVNQSINVKRKKSESEVLHQGTLTHLDAQHPWVYLQLLPESESLLERINTLISKIVADKQHQPSYQIDDLVIAQFSDDDNHYRARIQSYDADRQCYTVYFIDYGNTDGNVKEEQLFAVSKELEQIEGQARRVRLEKISEQRWRTLEKEKLNDLVEFRYLNEEKSAIDLQFDDVQTFTANISGTQKESFYVHLLPEANSLICEMGELIDTHPRDHLADDKSWSVDDLCIVFDRDEDQYFRGRILTDHVDVQCIDYGKILVDLTKEHLFVLNDDDVLRRPALAHQCRLFGVNEENQIKAIEEVIQHIDPNEQVTITVQSKDDGGCLQVMLFRENNEIVNDQFQVEAKNFLLLPSNSSDSAIAADGDHSPNSNPGDVQLTSPIGIPQAESTHQYGDTTNVTMDNQTIDFGENDPSTTTLIDEP